MLFVHAQIEGMAGTCVGKQQRMSTSNADVCELYNLYHVLIHKLRHILNKNFPTLHMSFCGLALDEFIDKVKL